jgi:sigma-E factor negative regulatory protein RseA
MNEKLSALVDGELHDEERGVQIGRMKSDAGARRAWDTYHLIGDALRGHGAVDFSGRVLRRLAEERTVVAPRRPQSGFRVTRYALPAAAGLAAVALVAWTALPMMRPQITAGAPGGAPIVPIAASAPPAVPETKPRLATAEVENYLLAHQPYSHTSAMQGVAPYVRTVAGDREGGAR